MPIDINLNLTPAQSYTDEESNRGQFDLNKEPWSDVIPTEGEVNCVDINEIEHESEAEPIEEQSQTKAWSDGVPAKGSNFVDNNEMDDIESNFHFDDANSKNDTVMES
ncbi:DNA-binding protein [Sesbania bispinosa]|nr:DNA-binding protein [Sesbania bispinosa]